jgi:uncharacterized SAM-binding protein YcdF (DUF218 family)
MPRLVKGASGSCKDGEVVVCVLGCAIGTGALARRARAAADAFVTRRAELVVACGGRAWGGRVEADELAALLEDAGVPREAIVRERCSLDTLENARFASEILSRRGAALRERREVLVVTCAWHLPRAVRHFRRAGLVADGLGVETPDATRLRRAYWSVREVVSSLKDARRPLRAS